MNLTNCYDLSGPCGIRVCRLSATRAWIEISHWLVVVVPDADDPTCPPLDPVCGSRERAFRCYTESAPVRSAKISLGDLTAWALRRGGALSNECGECEYARRDPDRQRVLGTIFDRNWIRDGLQWLYQQRVPFDAVVSLELVQSPARQHKAGDHVLIMRCGEWLAVWMCCKAEAAVGEDPLEASSP